MAFKIQAHGARRAVIKHIKTLRSEKPDGTPDDQSQIEALKLFLESEINALPTTVNGVMVSATGDSHASGRNVQVQIIPQTYHLDEA